MNHSMRTPARRVLLVMSMIFGTVPATAPAQTSANWQVEPFKATYSVRIGPAKAQTTVALVTLDDQRLRAESTTRARGIASWFKRGNVDEKTTFDVVDGKPVVRSLFRRDSLSSDDRNIDIAYRPEDGTARVQRSTGEDVVTVANDVTNPLLMQITLMQQLANNSLPESYVVLDYKGIQTYRITERDPEVIRTAAGKYAVRVIDLIETSSNTGTRVFVAEDEQWLAVRIEARKDDRSVAVLSLTDIERR
ncbi:MAG: DUF3108 domain-containing protein [Pseudomonadota bacterium]